MQGRLEDKVQTKTGIWANRLFPGKLFTLELILALLLCTASAIAAFSTQYQYNKDYFVGDYVTVEQRRFGLIQPRIQLIGMVESFDQNGRSLTPTFKETE